MATALACLPWLGVAAQAERAATSPKSLQDHALDRLPPDIRLPDSAAGARVARATYGDRLVERVERETPGASDWLEVEYTVVPELQERVRETLRAQGVELGHVVVMDPRSGDLLAYLSTEPERFPATRRYPAASLMKVVTAAAVLEHAPEAAERDCRSTGSPYELGERHLGGGGHDETPPVAAAGALGASVAHEVVEEVPLDEALDRALEALDHEWVGDFRTALAVSNNQCFGRYAANDLGAEPLLAEIEKIGLLESPGLGHDSGSVAPVEADLDLGHLGSGLAGSWISPLGAARLAGLLASGELVTPNWIAEVRDPQGLALDIDRSDPERVWEPERAQQLRDLLRSVTEFGTASRAFRHEDGSPRLGAIPVSGKTGTLNGKNPDGLYQWFIGVALSDAPSLAIATVVVHEAERGASASELAASVLEDVFCDEETVCDAARAERFQLRSAGREIQVARSRREAVAAARAAEAPLDAAPRPVTGSQLNLPRRLLRQPISGEIVLRVALESDGRIEDVALESSNLPERFDAFVLEAVRDWRFTPPRRAGRPVRAEARLAIPIRVN